MGGWVGRLEEEEVIWWWLGGGGEEEEEEETYRVHACRGGHGEG